MSENVSWPEAFEEAIRGAFDGVGRCDLRMLDAWTITGSVTFPNGLVLNLPYMGSLREVDAYAPYWREMVAGVLAGRLPMWEVTSTVPERLDRMAGR